MSKPAGLDCRASRKTEPVVPHEPDGAASAAAAMDGSPRDNVRKCCVEVGREAALRL